MFLWNWNRYIREGMLVEVGKGISPNFQQVLELLLAKGEYLAFAPDTEETKTMINLMSMKFPLLKKVPILSIGSVGVYVYVYVCVFRFHCYSCLSFIGQSKVFCPLL